MRFTNRLPIFVLISMALILALTASTSVSEAKTQCALKVEGPKAKLPEGKKNVQYSHVTEFKLTSSCGYAPNVKATGLPPGLCISNRNCNETVGMMIAQGMTGKLLLRGKPTKAGSYTITFTVYDEKSQETSFTVGIVVRE